MASCLLSITYRHYPAIVTISHQFSDLSLLVSHSKSSAYDTHRLTLGLTTRPIVTGSASHHTGSDGHLLASTLDFESQDVPAFDPLALMCRLTSTLCPLTRLDVLSHRVFFFKATPAPAQSQSVRNVTPFLTLSTAIRYE